MIVPESTRISSRLVLGLFVLAAGVLFMLDNLGYGNTENIWRYWPVVLVAIGLSKLLNSSGTSGRVLGLTEIVVGVLLLLNTLHIWRFYIWDLWPLVLVSIGISMVSGALTRGRVADASTLPPTAWVRAVAVLGSTAPGSNSQDFRGGEATAVLGSCEIDLRQASIAANEAVFDTLAVWGSVEIRIPDNWTVVVHGTPIMGSFEDKTRRPASPTKQLVIKGTAIMGSVEIKN